jgi:Zn finger protein HypA/HybF involved in hydrogenase expression
MYQFFLTIFFSLQASLAFAATENGRWQVGIGDPTIFGWLTVAFYLVAVWRCLVKTKDSKKFGGNYHFWLYLAFFLLFLAFNKQLDLQSWLTQTLRDSSHAHGWYAYRRLLQVIFIGALGLGMLLALISVRLFLANSWRRHKITWLGIMLLCLFILVRAASFHHFDIFINHDILGLKINVILEIGAISLIILGTYFSKKSANLSTTNTFPINNYIEIEHEGDDVQCPQCGTQPLSNTTSGRHFKCRMCGNKFSVNVLNG